MKDLDYVEHVFIQSSMTGSIGIGSSILTKGQRVGTSVLSRLLSASTSNKHPTLSYIREF